MTDRTETRQVTPPGPGAPARRPSLKSATAVAALTTLGAIASGWLSANGEPLTAGATPTGSATETFHAILLGNLRVVAGLLLGAVTLGLHTVVTLVANGHALGAGLAGVAADSPSRLVLLLRYAPLEFGALSLVGGATLVLVADAVACLAENRAVRVDTVVGAVVTALALLAVAALIEVRVAETLLAARR